MLSPALLRLDPAEAASRIETALREMVFGRLGRKGIVVGLSGGIDSSVVAALVVRALGKERALGLLMPETDSADESEPLGRLIALPGELGGEPPQSRLAVVGGIGQERLQ